MLVLRASTCSVTSSAMAGASWSCILTCSWRLHTFSAMNHSSLGGTVGNAGSTISGSTKVARCSVPPSSVARCDTRRVERLKRAFTHTDMTFVGLLRFTILMVLVTSPDMLVLCLLGW